ATVEQHSRPRALGPAGHPAARLALDAHAQRRQQAVGVVVRTHVRLQGGVPAADEADAARVLAAVHALGLDDLQLPAQPRRLGLALVPLARRPVAQPAPGLAAALAGAHEDGDSRLAPGRPSPLGSITAVRRAVGPMRAPAGPAAARAGTAPAASAAAGSPRG